MRTFIAICILLLLPTFAAANGYETYPTPLVWSPDSAHLASVEASVWPYNDGLVAGTLRIYSAGGGNSHDAIFPDLPEGFDDTTPMTELVAGNSIGSPVFSPDGKMLICVFNGKVAVFRTSDWSGPHTHLSGPSPALDCTFELAEDGSSSAILASFGERFYGADIWRVSFDGSKLEQLTHAGPDDSAVMPLSWPGIGILYLKQLGSGSYVYERIWALDTNSGMTMQLLQVPDARTATGGEFHESNVVPVYATGEIFYQRGGWGHWDVMRMQGFGNPEETELGDAQQPSVSADGRWLAFVRRPAYAKAELEYDWEVIPQVWLADRQCRQLWHVETSIAGGEFPALSPDGSRLAWLEYNGGKVQTVVRTVEEIVTGEATGTY